MKFTALNSGILSALASIVVTLIMYIIGPQSFVSGWGNFSLFAFSIILTVYLGTLGRKENGGYFTYGEAYKYLIVMSLVSIPVAILFKYILMVIDPGFFDQVNSLVMDKTVEMLEGFGLPEEKINSEVIKAENRFEESKSITGQFIGMGIGLGIMAVIDLLLALVIKKNKPEFES